VESKPEELDEIDRRLMQIRIEADALKKLATHLLSMRAEAWRRAVDAGELIEVNCYGEEELSDTVGCS
jgi:hypothetical protein